MTSADHPEHAVGDGDPFGLEDLRAEGLRLLIGVLASLAFLTYYVTALVTDSFNPLRFALMCALVLVGGLSYWTLRVSVRLAARVFVLSLLAILTAALSVFQDSLLASWFAPVVIVAGILVGWRSSLATAMAASAAILANHLMADFLPAGVAFGAVLLTWVGCILGWLLSRPAQTTLDWARQSYVRAVYTAEELRDRQGELSRVVKSLNSAYQRLEELNVDLARAREAAEEARRLKAEFAAAVSHELRTPLNLIIGFSEMLVASPHISRGKALPDAFRGDLEVIYRNACHLSGLIDDVLDLSQIEADRMSLHKEQVHLARVVDEAIAVVNGLFTAKGLTLEAEVPWDLLPVYADRDRVRQVLINLLSNAARFTDRGGVTVRARIEGAHAHDVLVAVSDTGVGIAPENLSAVFEEYRRVHVNGERRLIGSGLGLAVSKRFVELHGGSMWVESQPDHGSIFSFTLPTCEGVIASPGHTRGDRWVPPAAATGGIGDILVVDRDGDVARLLSRYLDGYRVLPVTGPVTGIEQVRQQVAGGRVRAVIVASPASTPEGPDLREVSEMVPGVPVVGCSFRTGRVAARDLGISDYLVKPVSREQIRDALRRLGKGVRSVVVVDDDTEMLRLLSRMVRSVSRRYIVREAQSGRQALALLGDERPDAVLLDLMMPDIDGAEVLRRMRVDPALRDVPVVVVTARGVAAETIVAEAFTITRRDGLSLREFLRCLRTDLDLLREVPHDTGPAPRPAPPE
ncbi:MAG: response regulator [Chloroflexi bacterium]|nr:response regulator [Chloroflexota bacterium]